MYTIMLLHAMVEALSRQIEFGESIFQYAWRTVEKHGKELNISIMMYGSFSKDIKKVKK